jgi:3-oxoacyl-[acyl-carrier-protein] synthase-3
LEVARLRPGDLDLIVVCTVTPDYLFPATACLVQDALGAPHAAAFDLSAGCTGFVYGLAVAADMVRAGTYRTALVIGAECLSRITDWRDRATCVLFGDGAGAVVLQAGENEGGVLATCLGADGSGGDLLIQPAGGSRQPASHLSVADRSHYLKMQGRGVFRFAVHAIPAATREVMSKAGLPLEAIDLLIPHQANRRILEAAARHLHLSEEEVCTNVERYGNTSAASIPIALCEAVEEGRVKQGDLVVCVGFGAGLTWGAAAIKWSRPRPVPLSAWRRARRRAYYRLAQARSRLRRGWRRFEAASASLISRRGEGDGT